MDGHFRKPESNIRKGQEIIGKLNELEKAYFERRFDEPNIKHINDYYTDFIKELIEIQERYSNHLAALSMIF